MYSDNSIAFGHVSAPCHSTNTVHMIRRHGGYMLSAALGVCIALKPTMEVTASPVSRHN